MRIIFSKVRNYLTSGNVVNISALLEVDGEQRLVEKTLVVGVDQRRDDIVDGEGSEGKTEDTINGILGEEGSDGSGLSEGGLGDNKLVTSGISESNGILSEESRGTSGTILDAPLLSVLDVGGGLAAVELSLAVTGSLGGNVGRLEDGALLAAAAASVFTEVLAPVRITAERIVVAVASSRSTGSVGDPQVGRSSIQDDEEGLVRGSDGDVTDVFDVLKNSFIRFVDKYPNIKKEYSLRNR